MILYCIIQHHEFDTIRTVIRVTREESVLEYTEYRYYTKIYI